MIANRKQSLTASLVISYDTIQDKEPPMINAVIRITLVDKSLLSHYDLLHL